MELGSYKLGLCLFVHLRDLHEWLSKMYRENGFCVELQYGKRFIPGRGSRLTKCDPATCPITMGSAVVCPTCVGFITISLLFGRLVITMIGLW